MNEAGGIAEGLEAYLRQTMTLDHRPKLLVKDTHMADKRRGMLQRYVEIGAIQDSVVIHSDPGVRPFLERPEEFRPMGFQEWRKFGSPVGAPGQALHHPAMKEHELNGWILAMHFLSALELLAATRGNKKGGNTDNSYQLTCPTPEEWIERQSKYSLLPPPVTVSVASMQEWSSLFFGIPTSSEAIVASPSKNNNDKWKMNPVHCRTTYDPIVDQAGSLTSIVVSGSTAEDMDLMLPKGHMFYNEAWVLDLSEGEKDAKRKLDRYDGLGYVDSKKAYRGLFTSGALRLLVPYERRIENNYNKHDSAFLKVGDRARDWFQTIVVCEVNERREPGSCELGKDVTYKVGGQNATNITLLDTPGTLYLGKKICSFVRVPEGATLTTREAMLMEDIRIPDHDKRKEKARQDLEAGNTTLGLALELSVHNHRIVARERACSLSHVVWEQRRPEDPRFPLVTEARRDKIDDASIGSSNSNNNDNGGNTENHHDPPAIIEAGNVEGAENIKPLKDYAVGVPQ